MKKLIPQQFNYIKAIQITLKTQNHKSIITNPSSMSQSLTLGEKKKRKEKIKNQQLSQNLHQIQL